MMHAVTLILWILLPVAFGALPPGYEEELYCPQDMCLKRKQQPLGWSGPRAAFHECCDETTGLTKRPHAWGVKVEKEVKVELNSHGWHQGRCTQQRGVCGTRAHRVGVQRLVRLLSRVDSFFQ